MFYIVEAATSLSDMASPAPGVQNKNRVAILADLDKEKRRLIHNQSMNNPAARPALNKAFKDHTEQQHIAAQQEAALQHAHTHSSGFFITQDSSFGNLILPVLPQPDPPSAAELQNL
ncbi:SOSS complex subunit C-like [Oncorhynchus keta]|uniref:SOSS complex subunit C-like n=1 Tax=Oncorhynchus keta TaxID=8018 RepID=UPI00227A2828|nr:SOSS complex subunit C-like [Oncorhynchus keta]XP_052367834.1 SOSS complex subunit C-like [Oncorhynchus keta]